MDEVKKAPRVKLPARASLWYIAASSLQRSVGVLGTPIFTRLLSAEEYGLYPLFNTYLGIVTVIATLEITGGIALRGMQKFSDRRAEFLSASVGLIATVFSIISVLYFAFREGINRLTGLSTPISALLLGQIFVNAVINLYTGREKYEYKYKSVALLNVILALGAPFISIIFIVLTNYRAEARIFGGFITAAAIAVPLLFVILKEGRRLFSPDIWRYLLRMALPLLPHYISAAAILRVGEIAVGRMHGTEALGRYSVAMSLGLSLTMITNGLISALSPWILRKIRGGEFDGIRDMLYLLSSGLCLLSLLILSVVPETMKIITPPEYHSSLLAVYPLSLSAVPMFLSSITVQGEMYYERSAISSLPSVIAALVSTTLAFTVLPHVDYRFVSVSALLSYIILFFLNALIFKRLSGEYPVKLKATAITYVLAVLYAGLLCLLRGSTVARIVLAIPLIPILLTVGMKVFERVRES
ncbi:MAG: oligosaccharide flippase family protein [Clostridia bacterium]|nr:oligosaccharide flippase family protein [Clostridia bacterium]